MGGTRPVLWGNLAGIVGNLIWATTIPVTEMLLATWPSFALAAGRLLTAALGVLLLFPLLRRPLRVRGIPWLVVLRLATFYMIPSIVLMIWGQDLSDPMAAAIVFTTMPLVSAVIGALQGVERVRASLLAGVGLAIAGGILASGSFGEGASGFRGGEIVLLASITLWVLFSRATLRELGGHDSLTQSLVTLVAGGGALALLSAALTGAGWIPAIRPDGREILLLLWMGCVGIGLSMPLWFLSVRLLGMTVASMHQNLLPFYVVVLAVLLGQGSFEGRTLLGATLVSLGALVAQLPWARLWRRRHNLA